MTMHRVPNTATSAVAYKPTSRSPRRTLHAASWLKQENLLPPSMQRCLESLEYQCLHC